MSLFVEQHFRDEKFAEGLKNGGDGLELYFSFVEIILAHPLRVVG